MDYLGDSEHCAEALLRSTFWTVDTSFQQLSSTMALSYQDQVSELRKNFRQGFTKSLEWRKEQLKNLSRMYEENEDLIVDALKKDLRKSKWESSKHKTLYLHLLGKS